MADEPRLVMGRRGFLTAAGSLAALSLLGVTCSKDGVQTGSSESHAAKQVSKSRSHG
jgi:hypothetical protein